MGGFTRGKTRIRFAPRETVHPGETPELSRRQGISGVPKQAVHRAGTERSPPGTAVPGQAAPASPPPGLCGPPPAVTREKAIALAEKRRRRGSILGLGKNRLVSLELVAWPVAKLRVKFLGGLLGRTVKTASFLIDAVSGDLVRIHRGFSLRPGFSEVMGLPSDSVRVVSRLPLAGATPAEVEVLTSLPREAVTAALSALRERRLVTESGRAGQATIFIPLLSKRLPSVSALKGRCDLALGQGSGRPLAMRVTEGQVREVLKGIEPTAEVVSLSLFSYPLYELVFSDGGRERRIYLDAITGKEAAGTGPEGR
jgi:hypothetical protein